MRRAVRDPGAVLALERLTRAAVRRQLFHRFDELRDFCGHGVFLPELASLARRIGAAEGEY